MRFSKVSVRDILATVYYREEDWVEVEQEMMKAIGLLQACDAHLSAGKEITPRVYGWCEKEARRLPHMLRWMRVGRAYLRARRDWDAYIARLERAQACWAAIQYNMKEGRS